MALLRDTTPPRGGPLRRMDARAKLVAALALTGAMAVTQTVPVALFLLVFAAALLVLARPRPGTAFKRILSGNVFLGLIALSLAFTYPGRPWAALPIISVDGARLGLLIALKGNAILCTLLALFLSTSFLEVMRALQGLGCPVKLALLLGFTYRQLFLVADELDRMREVARLRCFRPQANWHTYRTFAWFIGQSLLRASDRAVRIQAAMSARGFDGRFRPLRKAPLIRPWEIGSCLAIVLVAGFLLVIDRGMFL